MNHSERRSYEMLSRVRDFGGVRAALFPANTRGGELFTQLGALIAEADGHAEAKAARQGTFAQNTSGKSAARRALQAAVEAISRTARAMALESPGIEERFRLPRNKSDQTLLSTARAFFTGAEPIKADFIRHDLPAAFLENLASNIEDFERAITSLNNSRDARVVATNALGGAIARGVAIVRQLDAVVRNRFREDAATLAAWTSASRIERAARARRPAEPDAPDAPPPPNTPPPHTS